MLHQTPGHLHERGFDSPMGNSLDLNPYTATLIAALGTRD